MPRKARRASPFEEHGYEFGGPIGAFGISFGLPILVYVFTFVCNDISGCPAPSLLSPRTLQLEQLKREVGWPEDGLAGFFNWQSVAVSIGYVLLNAVLYKVLPAVEMEGTVLRSGGRLKYRFNTLYCHLAILGALAAGTAAQGADFVVWTFLDQNYLQLITANLIISYIVAVAVYVHSFSIKPGNKENRELAAGGQSGNLLYDWFIGRELNPRVTLPWIGEIDLKEWLELRPGMLGWIIMNCSFCAKQYRTFGRVTDSIVFITVIQALYIIDSWVNETAILTTMDITTDGFGFMLSFADFVWETFAYPLPARYLSVHPVSMGPARFAVVAAFIGVGFYIFRAANNQKNRFRTDDKDPRVAHLTYMRTKTGSKLITSGWWGVARHINYFGDWLQSWAYCLPTGLAGYQILAAGTGAEGAHVMADGREVVSGDAAGWAVPIAYFYIVYFAVLLIHRDGRDDVKCHRKYGKDWEEYKKIVRWRIIPGIY
ncbi:Delta14-sterol reductase [Geosmithia morbida]|uniref:Delta(14)-sterol reductase n=1 Tax=Geosmithia morbida TaxID=1094350 RepID=A0A9P4YMR2_9HYPO|nr:Delta14-sterol reductase [Geosmithia morbida]KAF4119307.1 Delta14-sterol reductase [Geosmithia morbida]